MNNIHKGKVDRYCCQDKNQNSINEIIENV